MQNCQCRVKLFGYVEQLYTELTCGYNSLIADA